MLLYVFYPAFLPGRHTLFLIRGRFSRDVHREGPLRRPCVSDHASVLAPRPPLVGRSVLHQRLRLGSDGTAPHPLRLAVLCRERPREFAAARRVLQQNRMGADRSLRAPSSPAARAHAPSARWCREARALSASPRSSHLLLDLYRSSRVCSGTQRCSRSCTSYLHPTYLLCAISSGNVCTMLPGFHLILCVLSLLLILHPVRFPLISMMIPFVNNLRFLFPSTPYLSISLCLCLCVSLSLCHCLSLFLSPISVPLSLGLCL